MPAEPPAIPTATSEPSLADLVVIGSHDGLAAALNPFGAARWWRRDSAGADLLWDGDVRVWAGRAPILFPIIGTLSGGHYRLGDASYGMGRHGFARHMVFETVEHSGDTAKFRLAASPVTRLVFPFDFVLTIGFAIAGNTLSVTATIQNHGHAPMPASFGFHPALRWPLVAGAPRAGHTVVFDAAEPRPIRRLDADGLLGGEQPSPVAGRTLALADDLFVNDAIVMPGLTSRAVTYGGPSGPRIRVGFDGFPDLGIWTKPGGGYICIEPWHGYADPAGFAGDVFAKPGIIVLAAGESWQATMTLTLEPAA